MPAQHGRLQLAQLKPEGPQQLDVRDALFDSVNTFTEENLRSAFSDPQPGQCYPLLGPPDTLDRPLYSSRWKTIAPE